MRMLKVILVCTLFFSSLFSPLPQIEAKGTNPFEVSNGVFTNSFYAAPFFLGMDNVSDFTELAKTSNVIEVGNVSIKKGDTTNRIGFGANEETISSNMDLAKEMKKFQEKGGKIILNFSEYYKSAEAQYIDVVQKFYLDNPSDFNANYADATKQTVMIKSLAEKYTPVIEALKPDALAFILKPGYVSSSDTTKFYEIKLKVLKELQSKSSIKNIPFIIDLASKQGSETATEQLTSLKTALSDGLKIVNLRVEIFDNTSESTDTADQKKDALVADFNKFFSELKGVALPSPYNNDNALYQLLAVKFSASYYHGPDDAAWLLTSEIVTTVVNALSNIKHYGIDQKYRGSADSDQKTAFNHTKKALSEKFPYSPPTTPDKTTSSAFDLDDKSLFKDAFYASLYRADLAKESVFKDLAKTQSVIEIGALNIDPSSKDLSFGKKKKEYTDFITLQEYINTFKNENKGKVILKFATQKYGSKTFKEPAAQKPALSDLATLYKDAIEFFKADAIAIPMDDISITPRIEAMKELQGMTGYENFPIILDIATQKNFKKTLAAIKDSSLKFSTVRIQPLIAESSSSKKDLPTAMIALLKSYQKIVKQVFTDLENPWEMISLIFSTDYEHQLSKSSKKRIELSEIQTILDNADLEGVKLIGTEQQKLYSSSDTGNDKKTYELIKSMNETLPDEIW